MEIRVDQQTSIEAAAADQVDALVGNAIRRRRCLKAMYNKAEVILAPYLLFARHGDPHIAALTVLRDGKAPREGKVGVFKLSGLREIQATNRLFTPRKDLLEAISEEHVIAKVGS
jgi:hypothetical protein